MQAKTFPLYRYGASILVETSDTLTAFQNLAYNPQCFVLNQMPNLPPPYWDDVSGHDSVYYRVIIIHKFYAEVYVRTSAYIHHN